MSERELERRRWQRWLSIGEVCEATGLSRSTVYRTAELMPVQMGKRRSLWLSDEVEAFIQSRIAARRKQEAA